MTKALEELLDQACPSIQYRVRLEIAGQSPQNPEMLDLQGQILQDKVVRDIMSWQQPDG